MPLVDKIRYNGAPHNIFNILQVYYDITLIYIHYVLLLSKYRQ